MKIRREQYSKALSSLSAFAISFVFSYFLTDVLSIALTFSVLAAWIPQLILSRRREIEVARLESLWPEILDHLISGLNSGLSIANTIADLGKRGPRKTREFFLICEGRMRGGESLKVILDEMRLFFMSAIGDQVCEVLEYSISSGSREIALTLRTLGGHIRANLQLKEEIRAKQEWIRNSAILAAIAPWLLLLVLCSQRSTVSAYSSASGAAILALGAGLTVLAYFWMRFAGKMESAPRVFLQ